MNKQYQHRIKQLLKDWENYPLDEKRAYLIQMRNLWPSDRTLRIDADGLIYYAAYSPEFKQQSPIDGGSFVGDVRHHNTLKRYKQMLHSIIANVVESCEIESFRGNFPRFKDYELIFTDGCNFRYDLFPEYKKSRKNLPRSNAYKRLKKYALTIGNIYPGFEADDVVYFYGLRGDPVASGDKDVVRSVPHAYHFHKDHKCVYTNTKEERERFILLQTLAGDSSDDIPGLKGVALKTADKLLPENATFEDVVRIYEEKGYDRDYAILMRRLVGLDQYKRGKLKLFQ